MLKPRGTKIERNSTKGAGAKENMKGLPLIAILPCISPSVVHGRLLASAHCSGVTALVCKQAGESLAHLDLYFRLILNKPGRRSGPYYGHRHIRFPSARHQGASTRKAGH